MRKLSFFFIYILFACNLIFSQNINLNQDFLINQIRTSQLENLNFTDYSFNFRNIQVSNIKDYDSFSIKKFYPTIFSTKNKKLILKLLPLDYVSEFSSHHPYNRNNGSLIPNRGYQQIISPGFFLKYGPLSINIKPEFLYAENKSFDGFPLSHYPVIWVAKLSQFNNIDIPERFGNKSHNEILLGQSSVKLTFKNISIGISNENIWWGPSIRNSIMMSNHARGFKHITINTEKPIKSKIGSFEFQLITGRLEPSRYLPPNHDMIFQGRSIYIPKINQVGEVDDWRFFQGLNISFSPTFIKGFYIGFIRWTQMYSALFEGRYTWMNYKTNYIPVFSNLFRKNDISVDTEGQIDQAAGMYFRWVWEDSKAEIYGEFHYNDSKQNLRDLLLDSDHARGFTLGLQKIFKQNLKFSWEWTQLQQTSSRLLREAGSWYRHSYVYHGYTNYGEVLGAGIGPGSNSQYLSLTKFDKLNSLTLAFEIIDQDNDFFISAFENAKDYRRYWKDYNFHIYYQRQLKNFLARINFIYSRNLNYQWELEDSTFDPYYKPGKDVNNLFIGLNLIYQFFK